ncbi:MAG: hypothetical protein JJ992_00650 [Planctomycetes bacterium]|jgi:hypothetical protein|nr:hypothetical protein [Planctomycetota bacterium]
MNVAGDPGDPVAGDASTAPPRDEPPGLAAVAAAWVAAVDDQVRSLGALAIAEARLATIGFMTMVLLSALTALFLFGAWALAIVAVATGLNASGFPLWAVMVALALINLAGARVSWHAAARCNRYLEFTETRAQLERAVSE